MIWTKEEIELLKTCSPEKVAEKTGKTLMAVYQKIHRLGLSNSVKKSKQMNIPNVSVLRNEHNEILILVKKEVADKVVVKFN